MKKLSTASVFVSTVALACLCGCASNSSNSNQSSSPAQTTASTTTQTQTPPPKPKKDKRPIEQRLTVGMTQDEVRQACGDPKDQSMNSDGSGTWTYRSGSPAYNPIFGWSAKFHVVTIVFDSNQKVKSWATSSSQAGDSPF
jgi:hypothetical protein